MNKDKRVQSKPAQKEPIKRNKFRKYVPSILLFLLFEIVAVTLWLVKKNLFYLLNFSYIGGCLGLGTALFTAGKRYARHFIQLAVGSYMLLYLGVISHENMQIEGFWYYLFLGVFEAATIHYAVAKIFGPLFFGRGWCGYACWTVMVLDFLPYKQPQNPRKEKLCFLRYVMFILSLALVSGLMLIKIANLEQIMFRLFIVGNVLYYILGIGLAFVLKDNRAFCKYLCPVTVFLKPMSYFSFLRVHCDESKCIHCDKCLWKLIRNPESEKMELNAFFAMNAQKLAQQRHCTRENGFVVMEQGNVECERQVNRNLLNHSHQNMNIFGKKKDIIYRYKK